MTIKITRALLVALAGAFLLQLSHGFTPVSAETQGANSLRFFKNYFVTGDYAEGGVGLRGKGVNGVAAGSIAITGVPPNADIVAAFLYWQVVTKETFGPASGAAGATFNGYTLNSAAGPYAKVLDAAGTAPCWSSGGGTGSSSGQHRTYTYRADVLRFFETDATTGKPIVNGPHVVTVPDSGPNGNSAPIALGASLVVVYRDSTLPLNAIVMYDGGFTIDNDNRTMSQSIGGFYQPAATPGARLTYIVGSGQPNKNEKLSVNGTLVSNPFGGLDGASWDSLTLPVELGPTPGAVRSVPTGIDTQGVSGSDCLSVGALVFKTAVQDTDDDGLLDVWESSATPILDPNGQPLPLLSAMGADPVRKDLFIEIGYMHTAGEEYAYGGTAKPAHSHLPSHEALKLVGDAFRDKPGSDSIRVHFDVGANYPEGPADEYIIRGTGARGGEAVDEQQTVCARGDQDPPWACQFADYPGTVGWKTGFRFIRDEVLSGEPGPEGADDDVCDLPGSTCERRFDRNRLHTFHYAFFAHAAGVPKSGLPCLAAQTVDGVVTDVPVSDVDGLCVEKENPDFRVPRTITGVGDFPGGDVLVTLGAFNDIHAEPVGTPFMQASTLMHELGHNFERRHGGDAFALNCKPTYLSVMNYLYQLRGLVDDAGRPHLSFSGPVPPGGLLDISEGSVLDQSFGTLPYRIGWYAPLAGSYLDGRAIAARKRCDGTDVVTGESMVRIDARTRSSVIDWNANGVADSGVYEQDVNYNGRTRLGLVPDLLGASNDWDNLKLNQIGARRNIGGRFVDRAGQIAMGQLSLETGRGDWGRGDWGRGDWGRGDWGRGDWGLGDLGVGDTGRGDWGRGDWGRGDWGRGDWGRGDWGRGDWGRGDWGRGDWGGGDLFAGDPNNPGGELDFETAGDLAKTPPNEFRACVIGVNCAALTSPLHQVQLDWTPPTIGDVLEYQAYRVPGGDLLPGQTWSLVGTPVPSALGVAAYTTTDAASLVNGTQYTYFAVAVYADGTRSDPSNLVTITARNDAPVLSAIANQTVYAGSSTGPLAFAVTDEDPTSVVVTGASSNTALVPATGIVFGGSGANRTVTVTPVPGVTGTATITLTATDGADGSSSITFTITATNDAPMLSIIASPTIDAGSSTGPLPFTVTDEDPASVAVTGASSNSSLVPAGGIVFGGSGANRTVTVTPAAGASGSATITLTATDSAAGTSTTTFVVTVQPRAVYTFRGFLTPLSLAGTDAAPSLSGAQTYGKAVPVKWSLTAGGTVVTNLASLRRLEAVPGTASAANASCVPNGAPALLLFDSRPTGNSTYRVGSGQFIFNWDTSAVSRGNCYRIRLLLDDGSAARVTAISFK